MNVAVGSLNPVKIQATKLAFQAVFPNRKWQVKGIEVKSGISNQPLSDEEAIKGATARAKKALKISGADFGVGLEGGMNKIQANWFENGWVVVVNKKGAMGLGSSARILLPPKFIKLIKKGLELGDATDVIFKQKNSKQKQGFFGLMTHDRITRISAYRDGIIVALSRFLHPEIF